MNADERRLKIVNNAFYAEAWRTKVKDECDFQSGGVEIVQTLGQVDVIDTLYSLQFYNHLIFDQQISNVVSNNDSIIFHLNRLLLFHLQTSLPQFVKQSVLVNLFQETNSQTVCHPERTTDNGFGHPI